MTNSEGLEEGDTELSKGLVSIHNHNFHSISLCLQIGKPRPLGPVGEGSCDCHVIWAPVTHMTGDGDSEVGVGMLVAVGDSG